MKLWVRGSILSVLALATIQAFASNQTTSSIALQATVPTTDNLTCSGPANFGTSVAYGTPACSAMPGSSGRYANSIFTPEIVSNCLHCRSSASRRKTAKT